MASLADIEFALSFYDEPYYKYIYLLQCTSNYPSSDESLNLNTIPMLRTAFNTHVGFSDHSFDAVSAIAAIACGARLIERHFTLDKDMHGPDHSASLDPNEFKKYAKNIRRILPMLGSSVKKVQHEEVEMKEISRKSLVMLNDKKSGDVLHLNDLGLRRPGNQGISPLYVQLLLREKSSKRSHGRGQANAK